MSRYGRLIGILFVFFFSGCGLFKPTQLTDQHRAQQSFSDLQSILNTSAEITGPLSLHEVIARGIVYNLDSRVKMMEYVYARNLGDVTKWDMLPPITGSAGYTKRSNQLASTSRSVGSGRETLQLSTSTETNRRTADLGLNWNILDFGTSVYNTRRKRYEQNIADTRRIKSIQNIMLDIIYAYWRAIAAERLISQIDGLVAKSFESLRNARILERKQVKPLHELLGYQKNLLESIRKLLKRRRELALAKIELGSLISIKPGTHYKLLVPSQKEMRVPHFKSSVDLLETAALKKRPELWEEDYNEEIAKEDVYKAYFETLPGINLTYRRNYDSNSFLFNQSWTDMGSAITFNIFKVLSLPSRVTLAKSQREVIKTRRIALSMAILTQLHIALERFEIAKKEYQFAREIDNVTDRIERITKEKKRANLEDNLQYIEDLADSLVGKIRAYSAYAEVMNAYHRIFHSIGTDPLPKNMPDHSLPAVIETIKQHFDNREAVLMQIGLPDGENAN
jgi:outer membrane protein TolC